MKLTQVGQQTQDYFETDRYQEFLEYVYCGMGCYGIEATAAIFDVYNAMCFKKDGTVTQVGEKETPRTKSKAKVEKAKKSRRELRRSENKKPKGVLMPLLKAAITHHINTCLGKKTYLAYSGSVIPTTLINLLDCLTIDDIDFYEVKNIPDDAEVVVTFGYQQPYGKYKPTNRVGDGFEIYHSSLYSCEILESDLEFMKRYTEATAICTKIRKNASLENQFMAWLAKNVGPFFIALDHWEVSAMLEDLKTESKTNIVASTGRYPIELLRYYFLKDQGHQVTLANEAVLNTKAHQEFLKMYEANKAK